MGRSIPGETVQKSLLGRDFPLELKKYNIVDTKMDINRPVLESKTLGRR
jgi:hypothetical protein